MRIENLAHRHREAELMDDPDLDSARHDAALRGLSRLNRLSLSTQIVWQPIFRLARQLGTDRLRVLDIATGAGDLLLGLWKRTRAAKLQLDLHGVDISPRALDFARQRSQRCGAKILFTKLDALNDELPANYDVLMSCLFLHHLSDDQAAALLRRMATATRHLVLINDLQRCRSGVVLAHLAARLFTTSEVVRVDAPRSVRAAFTIPEVRRLSETAGLQGATVGRRWPLRYLLSWSRP
jgi:SAM-dependent methyltransferase